MKITIIGAGNMGGAMIRGWIQTGIPASQITVAKLPPAAQNSDLASLGCPVIHAPSEACAGADVVVIAVKPRLVEMIATQIAPFIGSTPVVSVAAGISLEQLSALLPHAPLFRAIPNTAAQINQSITAVCSQNTTPEERTTIHQLLEQLGKVVEVDEKQLDAAMAVGSCGLAFALRYIHATTQGAVELGLKPALATQIAAQTLAGAAAMIQQNPEIHPEAHIAKITTAGGITIKGLNRMEELGFSTAIVGGLKACATPPATSNPKKENNRR